MVDELKWIRFLLGTIVGFIVIFVLKQLQVVFIPLIIALLLAFLFSPFHRFLRVHKIPKHLATGIIILLIFITLTALGLLVYTGVATFLKTVPLYEDRLYVQIRAFASLFKDIFPEGRNFLSHDMRWFGIFKQFSLSGTIGKTMGSFVDFLTQLMFSLLFLIFILTERDSFSIRVKKAMSHSEAKYSAELVDKIEQHVQLYLRNKTIISLLTSLTGMGFMWLFNIDFIILGGMLLFLLNYIPNIGSFFSSSFCVLLYFLKNGTMHPFELIMVITAFTLIQVFWGGIVENKLQGMKLNISPIFVLASLIFWGWVWGIPGMLLAVPLTSAVNIAIKGSAELKLVSAMMSDTEEK